MFQMKREGELPSGMLGNCLTIQQLHTGNAENTPPGEIYPSKSALYTTFFKGDYETSYPNKEAYGTNIFFLNVFAIIWSGNNVFKFQ